MTKESIIYGSSLIEYEIEYVPRKTLGISVHPDGVVTLKVPLEATPEDIREKVRRRAAWILRQKRYFESFGIPTAERQYISGESHLYLGRQYMLRVKEGSQNAVRYHSNILEVECQDKNKAENFSRAELREMRSGLTEYIGNLNKLLFGYYKNDKRIQLKTPSFLNFGF